ncbi:HigA family addiction module antitoxin [Lelliottia sp. V89_10]|uniref:HigA family addiction module antitoxin n=1 Tax=Lelliottia wanjuensis TaxID=3050585 RepID=UPI00249DDF1A|nr:MULTISPECIES: HigA family addiction module antitoxin [unclassified Lelliottia]MDI3360335.1 HigA family addiction module antitoxin [Lelliottia sp. V89_13]MDK9549439.1 HigA family addiction module antitoxin [Lelliottia sp. V89_5]MDK9596146.1 HigA family addiction module antitoxin [Lelliottia sp. V89_10]
MIAEYLKDYRVSSRVLARNLDVSPSALSKVTAGKTAISPEMALKLEAGLGIAARLWLAMQATYDLSRARKEIDLSHVVPASVKDGAVVH